MFLHGRQENRKRIHEMQSWRDKNDYRWINSFEDLELDVQYISYTTFEIQTCIFTQQMRESCKDTRFEPESCKCTRFQRAIVYKYTAGNRVEKEKTGHLDFHMEAPDDRKPFISGRFRTKERTLVSYQYQRP